LIKFCLVLEKNKKGKVSNFMKKLLMCTSLLSLLSFEANALKLYLASNHSNVGDHNQALGIAATVENLSGEKVPVEDLDTKKLTSAEIKDKIIKDLFTEKVIFIGTGEGGAQAIKDLPKNSNLVVCLTSHAFLPQYKDEALLEKVDYIALPTHVTPDIKKELGAKLIETTGVAHNRRPDMTTYDDWKKELPPADIYLGVYLGGDTFVEAKELKHFTEEDAAQLADYVIAKAKELEIHNLKPCILVLNGPRTGKYGVDGKEILTVHREGKADPITDHFAEKLADKGIEYKVFDFQYDTPENKKWVSAYNAFDLVAGAVRTTKGKMIVPGESTSVISEAIDVLPFDAIETLPPGKAVVYHHGAMQDVHKAHVASEKRASILENYQDITPASDVAGDTPKANKVIAQKLLDAAAVEEAGAAKDETAAVKDETAAVKDEIAAAKDEAAAVKDEIAAAKDETAAAKDELVSKEQEGQNQPAPQS
jgi:hypothetical protein